MNEIDNEFEAEHDIKNTGHFKVEVKEKETIRKVDEKEEMYEIEAEQD